MLWQEACARGHGSSSSPADDTGTAQDNVQQGVLLASGRARPPTPPKPKTTRTEGSRPKQLTKIKPTTKPRAKFNKVELVWKKKAPRTEQGALCDPVAPIRGLWPWLFP